MSGFNSDCCGCRTPLVLRIIAVSLVGALSGRSRARPASRFLSFYVDVLVLSPRLGSRAVLTNSRPPLGPPATAGAGWAGGGGRGTLYIEQVGNASLSYSVRLCPVPRDCVQGMSPSLLRPSLLRAAAVACACPTPAVASELVQRTRLLLT